MEVTNTEKGKCRGRFDCSEAYDALNTYLFHCPDHVFHPPVRMLLTAPSCTGSVNWFSKPRAGKHEFIPVPGSAL